MITYTPESREMIFDLLSKAGHWGSYSERFIYELHKKLSILHMREDNIYITYVEFKDTPNHEERSVEFSCEISLKWERGMRGGMVWHEFDKTFGIHT